MAKFIIVDIEKCLGCKSCEIACAVAHSKSKNLLEAISEEPRPQRRVTVEVSTEACVPLQCRHCEDAPCIEICPTNAISRLDEQSPVLIDHDKCIGCRFCLLACPFGVIEPARDGRAMIKCDLCIERTKEGEEPACVAACPTGALQFAEAEDWLKKRRRQAAEHIEASAKKGTEQKKK